MLSKKMLFQEHLSSKTLYRRYELGSWGPGVAGVGIGCVEGDNKLVSPTFIIEIIFFIFKQLVFVQKILLKHFDPNTHRKLETFFSTPHTP